MVIEICNLHEGVTLSENVLEITTTTRDKINLKWNSILEERMIEKCTILVDGMAHSLGPPS